MKHAAIGIVCIFTLNLAFAQSGGTMPAAASTGPGDGPFRISPGSVIPAGLTKTIDAKKAKVGDEVEARVTQDLTSDGKVVIAKDTRILGHVTAVQAHSKEQKESQLGIVFDHAILKGDENVPITMSIQAIVGPQPQNAGTSANDGQSSPGGGMAGGRGSTTGGGSVPPSPSTRDDSRSAGTPAGPRPPITAETKGVIGISNLNLADAAPGSLLSSEKGNVKIESGTFMLLRVKQ
jgi:hypothetical protein